MSAVSLALPGQAVTRPSEQPSRESNAGEQQLQKQQREQEAAHAQRTGAQLHQLLSQQARTSAVANAAALDATFDAAVSQAKAAASVAISTLSGALHMRTNAGDSLGDLGLQSAANVVAGARASINAAKLVALRESQHGDLADLVQLDQQAANAQGTIAVNLVI